MPAPLHHSQHQRRLTPRPARAPCARPHARTLYTRGRPLGSHGVAWRRAPRSAASAAVSVSWLRARGRADEHPAASAQAWRGSGRALGAATSGPPVGTGRALSHDASGQGARLAPRWSEVPVRVRATPQSDPARALSRRGRLEVRAPSATSPPRLPTVSPPAQAPRSRHRRRSRRDRCSRPPAATCPPSTDAAIAARAAAQRRGFGAADQSRRSCTARPTRASRPRRARRRARHAGLGRGRPGESGSELGLMRRAE